MLRHRVSSPKSGRLALTGLILASLAGACDGREPTGLGDVPTDKERLFVVEREAGRLAVLENGTLVGAIPELGNLNHATLKFHGDAGYVVSRDGYVSKIDPQALTLIRKVKVGESGIGVDFVTTSKGEFVVVANYDPKDVVVLDLNLELVRRIPTNSRNVGIKTYGPLVAFALMDKDELWVLDGEADFAVKTKIEQAGQMPFDALLAGGVYIAGFFKDPSLGHLDLRTLAYSRRALTDDGKELVLKVPHFGMWGVASADRAQVFVPAVGAKQLHLLDLSRLEYTKAVPLGGTPVFAVVSPDRKALAVNFSGEHENFVAIVDPATASVVRELEVGRRVMHLRFSSDSKLLHVSSYFDDAVRSYRTSDFGLVREVRVAKPSGIFLKQEVQR